MKVRDLIEKLQQHDPDDRVMVIGIKLGFETGDFDIEDVETSSYGGRVIDVVVKEIT